MATLSLDDVLLAISEPPPPGLGSFQAVTGAVQAISSIAMPLIAAEQQRKADRKARQAAEQQQQRLLQFEAEQAEKRRKTQARLMDQFVAFGALALGGCVALWAMSGGGSSRKDGRRR